jgi:hypothetical protein
MGRQRRLVQNFAKSQKKVLSGFEHFDFTPRGNPQNEIVVPSKTDASCRYFLRRGIGSRTTDLCGSAASAGDTRSFAGASTARYQDCTVAAGGDREVVSHGGSLARRQ